ncbi:MarR family transcriptional regulator [Arthrobacter psychrolactophilus]|uniref:MarR family transcriptional regulator n=2 Tax=Arthrobacter psychrolactophilus TaxID=92442 RepID=A0A2V5ITU2_9MICC|nr:MarR family transcriptional regulator [Arthrobacter psychrolactophilus]
MREFNKEPLLKELGSREYDVLFSLSRCSSGWLRLNELNDHVLLTQPSISRMVDRLESRGLVQRKTVEEDKRGVLIGLTEAGVAVQKKVGRAHVEHIQDIMETALSDEEMRTLLVLTEKLQRSVRGN